MKDAISRDDTAEQSAEVGDLLFACVNLARHLGIDPESALRGANAKFESRFRRIEALLAEQDRSPTQSDIEELDALWNQAKAEEKLQTPSPREPTTGKE